VSLPAPTASDYDITGNGNFILDGTGADKFVKVEITPHEGFPAVKTIWYTIAKGTPTETIPSAIGTYSVAFDVGSNSKYSAVSGLSAGFVNITEGGYTRPVLADFNVAGFPAEVTVGTTSLSSISITAKPDKTKGTITIIYTNAAGVATTGTATGGGLPTAAGIYSASFNVTQDDVGKFSSVTGLTAGTLYVRDPNNKPQVTPIDFNDFTVKVESMYNDPTTITAKDSAGKKSVQYSTQPQTITVVSSTDASKRYPVQSKLMLKYYNVATNPEGDLLQTGPPIVVGKYKVNVDLDGYVLTDAAGETLEAWSGTNFDVFFDIEKRVPTAKDYVITKLEQSEFGNVMGRERLPVNVQFTRKPTYKANNAGVDQDWISSLGNITVYYEYVSGPDSTWVSTTAIPEAALGLPGNNLSGASYLPKPPQRWGTYKIKFKVDAPVAGATKNIPDPSGSGTISVTVSAIDVANWAALDTITDTDLVLTLKELVAVQPTFQNFWIDEDNDVLQVTTPNGDNLIRPNGVDKLVLTLTGKGTVYKWTVNGTEVSSNTGNPNSYEFSSNAVGKHEVSVFVKWKPDFGAERLYNYSFKVTVVD
jgi:hypothetical protein